MPIQKKAHYSYHQANFLGFVVSNDALSANPEKIKPIKEWHEPKNICDDRSLHRLATFYH